MKLDSRQLRYFVAVAEELHFARAAERLHMSQPPLSQQIRQLERQLGVQLFERTQRSVKMTAAGEVLLTQARVVLGRLETAVELVQSAARGEAGLLRLGYTAASAYSLVPAVIRAYKQRHPAVEVTLHEQLSPEQLMELSERRLDVGLVRPFAARPNLIAEKLVEEQLVLALPANHRLAEHQTIDVRQLEGLALIGFSATAAGYFHDMIEALLRNAGVTPRIVQRATQPHTVISLVSAGLGVAVVPDASAHIHIEGVVYRELDADNRPKPEIHLCWRTDNNSPLLRNFLATAREVVMQQASQAGVARDVEQRVTRDL